MSRFIRWGESACPTSPRSAQDSQAVTGADGVWAAPSCVKATSLFQALLCGAAQLLQMWQEHGETDGYGDGRWRVVSFPLWAEDLLTGSFCLNTHGASKAKPPLHSFNTGTASTCQARRSRLGPWKPSALRMWWANQVVLHAERHCPRRYRDMKIYCYLYSAGSERCSLG